METPHEFPRFYAQATPIITLVVLAVLIGVNTFLQPSFVQPAVLQSNLTTFLP